MPIAWVCFPGTLTQNKLSLNDPILIGDITAKDLIFHAALASKREGGQDAIDFCICQALPADDKYVVHAGYCCPCCFASASLWEWGDLCGLCVCFTVAVMTRFGVWSVCIVAV